MQPSHEPLVTIEPQGSRSSLPIIDRPLDNTALMAYMECPKKYEYSMVLHRRRKGKERPPLVYGTAWHAMLEAHYKTDGDESKATSACILAWNEHGIADDHRTLQRCLDEYDNYRKRWGQRPSDEHDSTFGAPDNPMVELSVNAKWDEALHPYAGKIDRLVQLKALQGAVVPEDHKTTSALGQYYFSQFENDNQMMGYAFLAKLLTGMWVPGVRINAHAVLKRESKFERQYIPFAKDRLEDWAANYNIWVKRIEHSYLHNEWPRNHKACVGKYGPCAYLQVCSLSPRVRERVLESEFDIVPWNPLEADRDENGLDS